MSSSLGGFCLWGSLENQIGDSLLLILKKGLMVNNLVGWFVFDLGIFVAGESFTLVNNEVIQVGFFTGNRVLMPPFLLDLEDYFKGIKLHFGEWGDNVKDKANGDMIALCQSSKDVVEVVTLNVGHLLFDGLPNSDITKWMGTIWFCFRTSSTRSGSEVIVFDVRREPRKDVTPGDDSSGQVSILVIGLVIPTGIQLMKSDLDYVDMNFSTEKCLNFKIVGSIDIVSCKWSVIVDCARDFDSVNESKSQPWWNLYNGGGPKTDRLCYKIVSARGNYVSLNMCALKGKLCCWKLRSMHYDINGASIWAVRNLFDDALSLNVKQLFVVWFFARAEFLTKCYTDGFYSREIGKEIWIGGWATAALLEKQGLLYDGMSVAILVGRSWDGNHEGLGSLIKDIVEDALRVSAKSNGEHLIGRGGDVVTHNHAAIVTKQFCLRMSQDGDIDVDCRTCAGLKMGKFSMGIKAGDIMIVEVYAECAGLLCRMAVYLNATFNAAKSLFGVVSSCSQDCYGVFTKYVQFVSRYVYQDGRFPWLPFAGKNGLENKGLVMNHTFPTSASSGLDTGPEGGGIMSGLLSRWHIFLLLNFFHGVIAMAYAGYAHMLFLCTCTDPKPAHGGTSALWNCKLGNTVARNLNGSQGNLRMEPLLMVSGDEMGGWAPSFWVRWFFNGNRDTYIWYSHVNEVEPREMGWVNLKAVVGRLLGKLMRGPLEVIFYRLLSIVILIFMLGV